MKTLVVPIAVLGLGMGSAAAAQTVAMSSDEKVYAVEVISADTGAKILTIKTANGSSSLFVEDKALDSLRSVKPGDKIEIMVRDAAMGRRRAVTAVVSGTMSGAPVVGPVAKTVVEKTVVMKQAGTAVEFMNLDPATKKVTVLGENGEKRVLLVDERTMLSLSDVKPGQKLFVSYRFGYDGKPEAVVRVGPAGVARAVKRRQPEAIEVISVNPPANSLTIRDVSGAQRTLVVDDQTVLDLQNLKAGDTLLVELEGNRVMVVTRKN